LAAPESNIATDKKAPDHSFAPVEFIIITLC